MNDCPDCGSKLDATDALTAGWWCFTCKRYFWPDEELATP